MEYRTYLNKNYGYQSIINYIIIRKVNYVFTRYIYIEIILCFSPGSGCNSSPTQNKRVQKNSICKPDLSDDTANDDTFAATSCITADAADNADTQTDCDTSLDDSCADSVDLMSTKLPDMPDVAKSVSGDVGDQTFAVQTNKINDRVEKLRNGITKDTAEDVTVGQLYLMMGDPQKMVLQYEWTDMVKTPDVISCNQRLTNMLRRLIHIATTEFIDLSKSRPQSVRSCFQIIK